jgi:hypothetical protein
MGDGWIKLIRPRIFAPDAKSFRWPAIVVGVLARHDVFCVGFLPARLDFRLQEAISHVCKPTQGDPEPGPHSGSTGRAEEAKA